MLYRQSDIKWHDHIMTGAIDFPLMTISEKKLRWKYEKMIDTIGLCGCLITAVVNAHNDFFQDYSYTPGVLNDLIRSYHGYNIFQNNNCKIGEESYIIWSVLKTLLKIKSVDYYWTGKIDIQHPNYYYICRVPYSQKIRAGHYCFITGFDKTPIYHDSDTGAFRKDWGKYPDYFIHRLEF